MKLLDRLRTRLRLFFLAATPEVIAGMRDAVLVMNQKHVVIALNPAAEALFGQSAETATGLPVEQVLADQPALISHCCKEEGLAEVVLQLGGRSCYYELQISVLHDRSGRPSGRLILLHDITKRAQAQEASRKNQLLLKQSEEQYRYLIENLDEIIVITSLDGTITFVSPAAERVSGYLREEIIGKPFSEFLVPEDLPIIENYRSNTIPNNTQQIECRIVDRSGKTRFVRIYARQMLQDSMPIGTLSVAIDITERKQVEEALERRASQLAILNDIGEQIAATIELKRVLDSASQLIQKQFGYYHVAIFTPDWERGDLLMRSAAGSFTELFPENHHLKFGQGMVGWAAQKKSMILANDVRRESRYTNLFPERISTRSELVVPILIGEEMAGVLDVQSPQLNAFDDDDVRVMKTVADQIAIAMENARLYEEVRRQLEERERKENILRIQRDLLMHLSAAKTLEETLHVAVNTLAVELHASPVTIWLADWDAGTLQQVTSRGAWEEKDRTPVSFTQGIRGRVARSGRPVMVPDLRKESDLTGISSNSLSLLCTPLIASSKVIGVISLESGECNAFSQDDLRLLSTLANNLVVLIERARLFEEVERARSELENRAAELEEANASLRELDRLKSQFLANMSHELRTPLNSIIGFSEVLADGLVGTLNTEQNEFVHDILNSGTHLLKLINDLLDFSKIEAGKMVFVPSTFRVSALYDELRVTISPLIEKKKQVLVFRQDGNLPPLTADMMRIKQVFINLLSNANKFTPEGGCITTSCRASIPGFLLFTVTDTGIGIRPEDHEIIFEEFRQVDGSMTRAVPGTGLGLTISRRIIEQHGGRIWVESELEKGSSFFVLLPIDSHPEAYLPGE